MIKFIIIGIYAVLAVLLCLPVHLYLWISIKKNNYKGWKKSWKFINGFFESLIKMSGSKVEVRGAEHLKEVPQEKGILFIGNHTSFFDIIILSTIVDRPIGFIAKKEFKKIPFFSWWVADLGSLFLDRKNVRAGLETIKEGTESMNKGLSIGLYPEGTRNHSDELLPFKKGGYRMAEESDSPIILVAFTGADDIFENNKPIGIKKSNVIVEFSAPIYPHEMDKKERREVYDNFPNEIKKMLDTHK